MKNLIAVGALIVYSTLCIGLGYNLAYKDARAHYDAMQNAPCLLKGKE